MDHSEIERLTGKKRPGAQVAALRRMGIRFRETLAGRPVVTQSSLEEWVSGASKQQATVKKGFLDA